MSRKQKVLKRPPILPDSNFGSTLVTRLTNRIMKNGKKTVAQKIVVTAITEAAKELEIEPVQLLETAVNNATPQIEVKSIRVGGANVQVPLPPYPARALRLSLTWITNSARSIKGKPMAEKLKTVLLQTYQNEGPAIAKKTSVHNTAAGNRANAHYALRVRKKTA